MERAWYCLEDSELLASFAVAACSRIVHGDKLFCAQSADGEHEASLEKEPTKRRMLLGAIVDLRIGPHDSWVLVFFDQLILSSDVPWMIEQMNASAASDIKVRWASILASMVMRYMTFDVINPIFAASDGCEPLQSALSVWDPIDIESPSTLAIRSAFLETQTRRLDMQRKRNLRKEQQPPVAERIEECLLRSEKGDVAAGWQLHWWMSVDLQTGVQTHALHPDLRQLPGWINADESTRTRIVGAGRRFVLSGDDQAGEWAGQDVDNHAALSGYRSIRFSAIVEPSWVDGLSADVWRRWAAAILSADEHDEHDVRSDLVGRVLSAYQNLAFHYLKLFLNKNDRNKNDPFALRVMDGHWTLSLKRFILDLVRSDGYTPRFMGKLLDELLRRGVPEAASYATSILAIPIPADGVGRLRAHEAARSVLVHAMETGWDAAWRAIRSDSEFGREVFLSVSGAVNYMQRGSWARQLSEPDAVDVYLFLEREFSTSRDKEESRRSRHDPMTQWEIVAELRESVLSSLVWRGTVASVEGVKRISEALPDRDWTQELRRANNAMVQATWTPLTPKEVIDLRPRLLCTASSSVRGSESGVAEAPRHGAQEASVETSGGVLPHGGSWERLSVAIIDAYPSEAALRQMLQHRLGKNLAVIAGPGNLRNVVFELIQAANAGGWIRDLVVGARASNPGNSSLASVARDWGIESALQD
jgi:hypothetical protein